MRSTSFDPLDFANACGAFGTVGPERPRSVRARLDVHRFASRVSGGWWHRELLGVWIPPLSAEDPQLHELLRASGWLDGS